MNAIDLFQLIRINNEKLFLSSINHADIAQNNEFGQNLLHEAVVKNRIMMAEVLLANGVDVNQQDRKGQTPLHYAALHNSIIIAEKIIEHGGRLDIADDYGNEPLWTAVFNARGQYDLVKLYLAKGANSTHKNKSNRSPVDFANQIKDEVLVNIMNKVSQ